MPILLADAMPVRAELPHAAAAYSLAQTVQARHEKAGHNEHAVTLLHDH